MYEKKEKQVLFPEALKFGKDVKKNFVSGVLQKDHRISDVQILYVQIELYHHYLW